MKPSGVLVRVLVGCAIFLALCLFVFQDSIVREQQRDRSDNVGRLTREFLVKSGGDTAREVRFSQGTIRIDYADGHQGLFFKKTGEATEKKLIKPWETQSYINDAGSIFVAYPYLFQIRTGPRKSTVMIYDLEADTYEHVDLDNCPDAITTKVAYEGENIYWKQYQEWTPSCTGSYKKTYRLKKPLAL